MKATDLMIGDWVSINGKQVWVWTLTQHGIVGYKDGDHSYYGSEDDVEPIPLTAEILEKNGFTRFGTGYILKGEHFGLDNPSNPSNYLDDYWLRISIKAVHIEFVHELQRALRLSKINKDIVL